jgi:regulator of sirC expression with transglutaminase-like and TPR domain
MLVSNSAYDDFRKAVDCAEERLDLARAALAIASSDYPNLDIADYLSRIDGLAMEVAERLGDETNVYRSIAGLNDILFRRHGYRGNRAEYFDPKNSFLNEVMERKKGIPITLSVLYMEVARRIGFPLHGVGFPGHFLVKYMDDDQEIVIDPFNGGEIPGTATLENLLRRLYGGGATLHPGLLEPVTKKQTLSRLLNNLKLIYLGANDFVRGLSIIDRLLILEPDSAEDLRDRGAIFLKLECFQQALDAFETYLRLVPDAEDAPAVRKQAVRLRKQVRQIH